MATTGTEAPDKTELFTEHRKCVVTLHDHEPSWCSKRYWCETHSKWVTGPVCQVQGSGAVRQTLQKPY